MSPVPTICLLNENYDVSSAKFYFIVGVKEFEARWIGWAGVNVPDEVGKQALASALAEKVG